MVNEITTRHQTKHGRSGLMSKLEDCIGIAVLHFLLSFTFFCELRGHTSIDRSFSAKKSVLEVAVAKWGKDRMAIVHKCVVVLRRTESDSSNIQYISVQPHRFVFFIIWDHLRFINAQFPLFKTHKALVKHTLLNVIYTHNGLPMELSLIHSDSILIAPQPQKQTAVGLIYIFNLD